MDITDIMVSFWISYDGIFYRIAGISGTDVCIDSGSGKYVAISECSPVRITPDILEENGFFGAKERFVFGSGTDMLILSYDSAEDVWTMSISLHDTSIEMKYVHELQMALKSHRRSDIDIDIRRRNTELRKFNYARVGGANVMLLDRTEDGWVVGKDGESVPDSEVSRIEISDSMFPENRFVEQDGGYALDIGETGNGDFMVRYSENEQWLIDNKRNGKTFRGSIRYFNQLQNILDEIGIPADLVPEQTEKEVSEMLDEAYK